MQRRCRSYTKAGLRLFYECQYIRLNMQCNLLSLMQQSTMTCVPFRAEPTGFTVLRKVYKMSNALYKGQVMSRELADGWYYSVNVCCQHSVTSSCKHAYAHRRFWPKFCIPALLYCSSSLCHTNGVECKTWTSPDMPTRTANQKRVSHAGGYCRQSFHFNTPVNNSTDRPAGQYMR